MSMTDELDRLMSRAIGQCISLERRQGIQVHATKRSNAVVAKTAADTLLLASRRKTQR